jgi:hypothetical protein
MADPVGFFDTTAVPEGWFDQTLQAVGWFDADLLNTATEDPPGESSVSEMHTRMVRLRRGR